MNKKKETPIFKKIFDDIYNIWDKTKSIPGVVIYTFVAIDAFSFLAMPTEQSENNRSDFISWVDKYLKTEKKQAYQYTGKDFYGARCAQLHAFSAESQYSKDNDCKIFVYHDGSEHCFDPLKTNNKNIVMISVPRLIDDLNDAIANFGADILNDNNLKQRIESRYDKVCDFFEIDDKIY